MVNGESGALRPPIHLWKWGLRLGSLMVFALGWELVGRRLQSLLMPTCRQTLAALVQLVGSRRLWEALWTSNQAMALGFALAAIVGVFLGLLMGRSRATEKLADPYLSILLVTPMSALIPIVIMALGLGLAARVMVVFSFAVVMIAVNTRAGLRMIDPTVIEMALAFGASEHQVWRKVLLPGALAGILSGLRLGLMGAVSGMIAVELLLVAVGLGRLIMDFQGNFEAANLYATIIVVIAESVMLLFAFKRLERRMTPWTEEVIGE